MLKSWVGALLRIQYEDLTSRPDLAGGSGWISSAPMHTSGMIYIYVQNELSDLCGIMVV